MASIQKRGVKIMTGREENDSKIEWKINTMLSEMPTYVEEAILILSNIKERVNSNSLLIYL